MDNNLYKYEETSSDLSSIENFIIIDLILKYNIIK